MKRLKLYLLIAGNYTWYSTAGRILIFFVPVWVVPVIYLHMHFGVSEDIAKSNAIIYLIGIWMLGLRFNDIHRGLRRARAARRLLHWHRHFPKRYPLIATHYGSIL